VTRREPRAPPQPRRRRAKAPGETRPGPGTGDLVAIETWARGDSLEVRHTEKVYVRTWSTPGILGERASHRQGLPSQVTPGTHGPFESSLRVRCRVAGEPPPAAPGPPAGTQRKKRSKPPTKQRGRKR